MRHLKYITSAFAIFLYGMAFPPAVYAQQAKITSFEQEMDRVRDISGPRAQCRRMMDNQATCVELIGEYHTDHYPYQIIEIKFYGELLFYADGRRSLTYRVDNSKGQKRIASAWIAVGKKYGLTPNQISACEYKKTCYVGDLLIYLGNGNEISISRADAF